jgi:hypothetical protein
MPGRLLTTVEDMYLGRSAVLRCAISSSEVRGKSQSEGPRIGARAGHVGPNVNVPLTLTASLQAGCPPARRPTWYLLLSSFPLPYARGRIGVVGT